MFRRKERVCKRKRGREGEEGEKEEEEEGRGGEGGLGGGEEETTREGASKRRNKKTPFLVVVAVVGSPGRFHSPYVIKEIDQPPQPACLCIPLDLNPMASAVGRTHTQQDPGETGAPQPFLFEEI